MFHPQNNFHNPPLHVPMVMPTMNHFPNQIDQHQPQNPNNFEENSPDTFTEVINISKIKDGFFIGDKLAAISIDVVIQFKITHFINATGTQIMNQWESLGINYLTLNWSENERQILFDGKDIIADKIVEFIDNSFIEGEGLLAHSFKGQNRVCLVVLIYLMKKYKWSLNKSLDYLKSKKNDVDIVPYFYAQLVKFEERLRKRGELNSDIPWPSTFLLKDKDEKLICNTYMNGLPSEKDNLKNENFCNNNEIIRHIIWNDENPVQKGPLEIVDRDHDLFLEKDIKPVTSHQRIRPTKKCIKNSGNNNKENRYNIYENNLNLDKNKPGLMNNNYLDNNNINNYNFSNNNKNNKINNINNENYNVASNSYNLGSLNSLNPENVKNYGVIYDNNNNIINNFKNKNGINFNENTNFNNINLAQNNNQINTNTSINMKKANTQIQNNNINNKPKRTLSKKKNDKTNNLSSSTQNFISNKYNNLNNNIEGRPLNYSMNDFVDKKIKINNNENINNINNNYDNRPLVEDIYGNNFEYIKHNNNAFLSNNNYNNKNINNNKINKASYGINYNNNNIHNTYNNITKNKPLNNFNPNLIKKKASPQSGHNLLNRNKSNLEEGPVKIKKNNYLKNLNSNITNYNYNSNKKPTTPDFTHYSTTGFLSESNNNYNNSMTKTNSNSSSILGGRPGSMQKYDTSSGIFGYGKKTGNKNKFSNNSIKRPATAPHKDKVKVPMGAINKKNYVINDKKPKFGKFNQRPQSAEGKNKPIHKNYNTTNNHINNINEIMGMNKNLSNSNMISNINNSNKKYGINNIKNNLQNKRISSPINPIKPNNINNNKNLFNGSKYNNPKYRMPSPMITNFQRKTGINNSNKIGISKSTNLAFK